MGSCEDSCKKGHMAPVNDARTLTAQYFHKERYFTGPEDSFECPILTINRSSVGLQLKSDILKFLNEATKNTFSIEITLS